MRDPHAYREILDDFIGHKVELFGRVAITRARSVSGLRIGDDGRVIAIDGDPLEALIHALAVFEKLSGKISTVSASASLTRLHIRERYPGLELPSALQ